MPTSPQYLSTSQAAEHLGLSREHVRRLIQRGELHAEETVNGFMLYADKVEQYAIQRRVLQDQRQFRAAVDDLASQARRVDKATGIQSAITQVRDQMKQHSAFEVPAVVAPQLQWIEQEVAAQKALAILAGSAATVVEQWRRYERDVCRAEEIFSTVPPGCRANGIGAIDVSAEKISAAQGIYGASVVSATDPAAEKFATAYAGDSAKAIAEMESSIMKAQEQAMGGILPQHEMLKDVQHAMEKARGADRWLVELRRREDDIARGKVIPEAAAYSAGMDAAESMCHREQESLPIALQDIMRDQDKLSAIQEGDVAAPWLRREERVEELRRGVEGRQGVYGGQSGSVDLSDIGAAANAAMHKRQEDHFAAMGRKDDPLATASLVTPHPPEMARGFAVPESREARLEEKVDELNRKVEQLTELVMQQRADTMTAMPTWQEWAGSDRPEDVLAKLDAIRAGITGGKQAGENSTDVIREAREAQGQDG